MTLITLRVLEGANRGTAYENLTTPVTIGREEGNVIQLNDERVSRFHAKIQEDQDQIVLTDLESTNGTKVNGEEVSLRLLRHGDVLAIGRSVLLYGTREQIARRLAELRGARPAGATAEAEGQEDLSLDAELHWTGDIAQAHTLHALSPPEPPQGLTAGQAAQLVELLEYLHLRIRDLSATIVSEEDRVSLDLRRWQDVIDLEGVLAGYLRAVSRPGENA